MKKFLMWAAVLMVHAPSQTIFSITQLETIQKQTIECLKRAHYYNQFGERISLKKELHDAIKKSRQITYDSNIKRQLMENYGDYKSTTISIVNEDCVKVAIDQVKKGNKPLLLNMANAEVPGGAYLNGAPSQESHLFRCSALPFVLDRRWDKQRKHFYEFPPKSAVYSPDVPFFRISNDKKQYTYLDHPFLISVVSCAAKPLKREKDWNEATAEYTRACIRDQLYLGMVENHDVLVLGAFGCGVFNNPPQTIATIYLEELQKLGGVFKEVIFSILPENSKPFPLQNENFAIFKATLQGPFLRKK